MIDMTTFETAAPIKANIEIPLGEIKVLATSRTDTAVTVRPTNPTRGADCKMADTVSVDYLNGFLYVKGPKPWFYAPQFMSRGSVDVIIELPERSSLKIELGMGNIIGEGTFGNCSCISGMGSIAIGQATDLNAKSGHGDIEVQNILGNARITSGSGRIQIGTIEGNLTVKSGNGDITIDTVSGDADFKTGNGRIEVGHSLGTISAKSGNGKISVGGVVRGKSSLFTGAGSIDIGVDPKTRVWLDVFTHRGAIRNTIPPKDSSSDSFEKAEVTARTSYGDIAIYQETGVA